MKLHVFKSVFVLCCLSLLSTKCSIDDDDDGSHHDSRAEIQQINEQVQSATWYVSEFIDSGRDETAHFNGYSFEFRSNGNIVASNGSNSFNGDWFVTDSSRSSDDDDHEDIDFNIFFNVSDSHNFEDLNDDWDIIFHSEQIIRLRDVSGGNGGTDTLTFERR